jgi:hypothetical protein
VTVPPPTATLVDLEAAWLTADDTVNALSPVTAYARKRQDGAKASDLRIVRTRQTRVSNGRIERAHSLQLALTWPLVSGASSMTTDQRYLDALIDALLARIRGTAGDHTHGGLWLSAGETSDGPDGNGGPDVARSDPLSALEQQTPSLSAVITYGATEQLITN